MKYYLSIILFALLVGCATSTTQPGGTVVEDPPIVQVQKNVKFWRGELDVAKGVLKSLVDKHEISDAKAAKYTTWITIAQTALGLAVDGTDNYSCLKDLSCTDAQLSTINEGIGEAIGLILSVKGG